MQKKELSLQIVHPYAAGIDVGSRSHFIAVDQDPEHVTEFGVYTRDNLLLIEHLKKFRITTVAMESTGSYWQTLFNALQAAGFDVHLVNGSQTKNVKGRKTRPRSRKGKILPGRHSVPDRIRRKSPPFRGICLSARTPLNFGLTP